MLALRLKAPGDSMMFSLELRDLLRLPAPGDPELAFRFALGSRPLADPLRGFATSIPLWLMNVEYRFLVQSIEQGVGSWPIFVDDLRGSIFFDIGSTKKLDSAGRSAVLKASLGVELHLAIYLGYVLGPITLRAGAAQGIGEAKPQFYFGLGTAF